MERVGQNEGILALDIMNLEPAREGYWPNLNRGEYRVTSEETPRYNCIAWAVGDSTVWWQPNSGGYWPDGVPDEVSVNSLKILFEGVGYRECASDELEVGFEKVAIFVDGDGLPTHVARQLSSGNWTSKLGHWEDIEHQSLRALAGSPKYGTVALLLRRSMG